MSSAGDAPSAGGPAPARDAAPLDLAGALCALLLCQLAGEVAVGTLRLAAPSVVFPGPVVGMGFMLAFLFLRGGPGASLDATSGAVLRNLSLLFVPAAVGIVQHGEVISRFGLALVAALVGSTVLTLLVTVGVFLAVARRIPAGDADGA